MDKEKIKSVAASASRLVATSAQLAKKQAELATLRNVTLPKLYYSVGRKLAGMEKLPPDLAGHCEVIKELEAGIANTPELPKSEPAVGFAAKAKQIAQHAAKKAAKATGDAAATVQIQAAYVALGKAAVERYGLKAVPKQLQSDLSAAERQIEALTEEIAALKNASAVGSLTPRRVVLAAGSLAGLFALVFVIRSVGGLFFSSARPEIAREVSAQAGEQATPKRAASTERTVTPPRAVEINLDFLVRTALVKALGEESQVFTSDTFKEIRLGDRHVDEPGKSNAPFDAPHWLSVSPHHVIETKGRLESTRVFVEKESNRVVMISVVYDPMSLEKLLPDVLETFGKTPQEILTHNWEQNRHAARSTTLRYTFPRTVVRIKAIDYSGPIPVSRTQIWVFDRAFIEKSLLAYGKSVIRACDWLRRMRDVAEEGRVEPRDAVPIKGCEIRDWDADDGQVLLYVDTSREGAVRSVRKAAKEERDFLIGLSRGGVLQPFDVALFATSSRGQQLVICPDASASMRVPELKSYHEHLEGSILHSPITDIVATFTSSIVQELFPPEGENISIISQTNDTYRAPDEAEAIDRRKLQILSRASGDRDEWVDQNGWQVRVSERGAISLTRRKGGGL